MKKILFVCSGNIFRSLTAELCANRYILESNIKAVQVKSAGTVVPSEHVRPVVIAALKELGLDSSLHKPTRFTLESAYLDTTIIAMGLDHQRHLAEKFNVQSQLFNQVAGISDSPVLDVHEALPVELLHAEKGTEYIKATIEYINNTIPAVIENVLAAKHG